MEDCVCSQEIEISGEITNILSTERVPTVIPSLYCALTAFTTNLFYKVKSMNIRSFIDEEIKAKEELVTCPQAECLRLA